MVNSKRKGSLAVGEAIAFFTKNNESVFIPVSDCDKYDLVVYGSGTFKKIQCKYSNDTVKSGGYIVDLRTFGGYREKTYHNKYIKDDFDFLFVLCGNGNTYLIPIEKIIEKSQIVLGVKSWNEFKC
jgi:hypothetical protein